MPAPPGAFQKTQKGLKAERIPMGSDQKSGVASMDIERSEDHPLGAIPRNRHHGLFPDGSIHCPQRGCLGQNGGI